QSQPVSLRLPGVDVSSTTLLVWMMSNLKPAGSVPKFSHRAEMISLGIAYLSIWRQPTHRLFVAQGRLLPANFHSRSVSSGGTRRASTRRKSYRLLRRSLQESERPDRF